MHRIVFSNGSAVVQTLHDEVVSPHGSKLFSGLDFKKIGNTINSGDQNKKASFFRVYLTATDISAALEAPDRFELRDIGLSNGVFLRRIVYTPRDDARAALQRARGQWLHFDSLDLRESPSLVDSLAQIKEILKGVPPSRKICVKIYNGKVVNVIMLKKFLCFFSFFFHLIFLFSCLNILIFFILFCYCSLPFLIF